MNILAGLLFLTISLSIMLITITGLYLKVGGDIEKWEEKTKWSNLSTGVKGFLFLIPSLPPLIFIFASLSSTGMDLLKYSTASVLMFFIGLIALFFILSVMWITVTVVRWLNKISNVLKGDRKKKKRGKRVLKKRSD